MKVYIASDHGGFVLKNALVKYLSQLGFEVSDLGPASLDPKDDYSMYATTLARAVAGEPNSKGILLCRNGVGVSITANKIKGVRCALSWDEKHAKSARNDDAANILALPADYLNEEKAKRIVDVFLATPFDSSQERFNRRLSQIAELEKVND